jgi:hypothetical protein
MISPVELRRSRLLYAVAGLGVIAVGLASRRFPGLFPPVLGKYPGDALWALMVFLVLGIILPRCPARRLGVYALAVSFLVEFSQLYQAPWIDAVRSTTPGHLVLGSTFVWGDLAAYAVGVGLGIFCEEIVHALRARCEGKAVPAITGGDYPDIL